MTLQRDRSAWNAKRRKRYAEDLEHRERRKAQHRAYYAVHKEQIKERQRRRSWAKKLSDFWRRLARFYGIFREQYEALLAQQGGDVSGRRRVQQHSVRKIVFLLS